MITFAEEEMLHYLYQNALHAPLTYEPFRLINVADIVGFTEARYETLDWKRIRRPFPLLYNALTLLDHIVPWAPRAVPSWMRPKSRLDPRPFVGWPKRRLKELKAEGCKLTDILARTFLPSKWRLMHYYWAKRSLKLVFCLLCWRHLDIYTGGCGCIAQWRNEIDDSDD